MVAGAAYIGLGTNLGDRCANLRRALDRLRLLPSLSCQGESSVYETEPWGYADQPAFLNMVVKVSWNGTATELLEACQDIERQLGRVRGNGDTRWGPRVIDLDLLLFDSQRITQPGLVVPHPRMHKRAFVMVPLAELDGSLVVRGRPVRQWAHELSCGQGVERVGRIDDC